MLLLTIGGVSLPSISVAQSTSALSETVIPLRVVMSYECVGNVGQGCRSIDRLQDAVRRGHAFWDDAGVRFWVKSLEYYDLPRLRTAITTVYTWADIRDEIQQVFPNMPDNAFPDGETKESRHWTMAAAGFYGDPTEVFVLVNDARSSAGGPWGSRMVWLHANNIWKAGLVAAPTTLPHELGHFLGLQHPNDGPGGAYFDPSTGNPYGTCDFWDQIYFPGLVPQFFPSPTSPGCDGSGLKRIGRHALVHIATPTSEPDIAIGLEVFQPQDWQTQMIARPTGQAHLPPDQWGFSYNLMGGFIWSPWTAALDGRAPRHLVGSQIAIVHDFLTHEHPVMPYTQGYLMPASNTIPPGAVPNALSSQRPLLGTAEDDFFWWSNGTRTDEFSFAYERKNLGPGYRPVAGDFDGALGDDIFWYRPATGTGTMWWSNGDGTFDTEYGFQNEANARLLAGDFDGNGIDDLYFYVPGASTDVIAYGQGARQFSDKTHNVHSAWDPFAADLDGDQDDDVVRLDELTGTAVIWWSDAESLPPGTLGTTFTTETGIDVGGGGITDPVHCRKPIVGNFDQSFGDDVFFYCAGTGSEKIWKSNGTQSPTKLTAFGAAPASVSGVYRPFAGDFDGDGFDDIFWDDPNHAADAIWAGGVDAPEVPDVHRTDIHGYFEAVTGDFDDDGDTDIFWYRDEAERWIESFGASTSAGSWQKATHPRFLADVDGDDREDIVGFGIDGVYVALSSGDGFGPMTQWHAGFGANGWDAARHPRLVGDVDNDGKADVVGFGNSGVWVARSTGTSFQSMSKWVTGFGYSLGWAVEDHPRMLADVDGDDDLDVVGFHDAGVWVSRSTGTSFTTPALWVDQFGTQSGWKVDRHPRFLADVDKNGMADVVGFGNGGVWVSLSTGSTFLDEQNWVSAFGYNQGWRADEDPRFVVDVDGDDRADIVGLEPIFRESLMVSLSTGSGFTAPVPWVSFGKSIDLTDPNETLVMADVSGDGKVDAIVFGKGDDTLYALSTGTTFTTPRGWIDQYGAAKSWNPSSHIRSMADVDGDGRADLVGFGGSGVWVWKADFCFAGQEN